MTCDDTKELILAKNELDVFKSFPSGSMKDPLWSAWYAWDDAIFGKCVQHLGEEEESFLDARNAIAYGQVDLSFL